jgi:quercetin dioxygenase-like cupin family protein
METDKMAQVLNRVIPMALETSEPYFTLKPQQNHVIKAQYQVFQVVSGVAWVSNLGEDYVLKVGDAITLMPGGDHVAVVSGLYNKPMRYTLRGK